MIGLERKLRLKNDEFVPKAPMLPATIRIEHCRRSKRKLYITRCDDGTILAYCHHCGASGYYAPATKWYSLRKNTGSPTSDIELPTRSDLVRALPEQHEKTVAKFKYENGIQPDTLDTFGVETILYQHTVRIMFPIGEDKWAAKLYDKDSTQPKWITTLKGDTLDITKGTDAIRNTLIVVVEDIISSMLIYQLGYSSLVLMGTQIRPSHMHAILCYQNVNSSEWPTKVVVWLDNDNVDVRSKSKKLKLSLNDLGVPTFRVKDADPKRYLIDDVKRTLHELFLC